MYRCGGLPWFGPTESSFSLQRSMKIPAGVCESVSSPSSAPQRREDFGRVSSVKTATASVSGSSRSSVGILFPDVPRPGALRPKEGLVGGPRRELPHLVALVRQLAYLPQWRVVPALLARERQLLDRPVAAGDRAPVQLCQLPRHVLQQPSRQRVVYLRQRHPVVRHRYRDACGVEPVTVGAQPGVTHEVVPPPQPAGGVRVLLCRCSDPRPVRPPADAVQPVL